MNPPHSAICIPQCIRQQVEETFASDPALPFLQARLDEEHHYSRGTLFMPESKAVVWQCKGTDQQNIRQMLVSSQ